MIHLFKVLSTLLSDVNWMLREKNGKQEWSRYVESSSCCLEKPLPSLPYFWQLSDLLLQLKLLSQRSKIELRK